MALKMVVEAVEGKVPPSSTALKQRVVAEEEATPLPLPAWKWVAAVVALPSTAGAEAASLRLAL